MSRISINKASQDFNISRNTLYKYIKQGKITRDSDGKLDTTDLIRLFSDHANVQQLDEQQLTVVDNDVLTANEQLKQENEHLKQQLLSSETRINELKQQLEYVKQNENWLKQQLDQKLIEQKSYEKKGLLGRLFG
ncbi:plasmid replication DNA-binding protein (plasmid) [Acinetobacter baumannii]